MLVWVVNNSDYLYWHWICCFPTGPQCSRGLRFEQLSQSVENSATLKQRFASTCSPVMGIFRKNPLGILFRGWSDEAQSRAFYKSMDGINSHRPQQISF